MRICVFTHTFPRYPGDPVAPFMKDFALGLAEHGNTVIVLTPYDKNFHYENFNKITIETYKYIYPKRFHLLGYSRTLKGDQKFNFFVYLLAPLMLFFSFFALFKTVKKYNIQIISAHWILPNGFIAAIVSKLTKIPLVISVPGSDVYLSKKNLFFKVMTEFAGRQAKYIVSNSTRYLDELKDLNIDKNKFKEIPYGIDINKFPYPRKNKEIFKKKFGFLENEKIVLAVGRLVEKKGFEYLIRSIPYILNNIPSLKLIIIGDGSEKSRLLASAEELGISDYVLFVNKVNHDQLFMYYTIADVYVAPSIKDSFGNLESHIVALFEAIGSGIPVVSTELGVSQLYVKNGINGYRVREKDEKDIAHAIISILNSKKLENMGKESRKIAQQFLSYDTCTKEYDNLFRLLVN